MVDYAAVLTAIRPNSLWSMVNNDYSTLDWQSDDPKPTKKTLDDAWPQVDYDNQYAAVEAARRTAYQAQTDGMYFHAIRHAEPLTEWEQAVAAIKIQYPYPEGPA
jgi:uncharacterized protein (DUF2225 family)